MPNVPVTSLTVNDPVEFTVSAPYSGDGAAVDYSTASVSALLHNTSDAQSAGERDVLYRVDSGDWTVLPPGGKQDILIDFSSQTLTMKRGQFAANVSVSMTVEGVPSGLYADGESLSAGGGSVDLPALAALGVPRVLDLGVITAADLGDGALTLYTPAAGEIAGPVLLRDVVFVAGSNSLAIVIGREEQIAGDTDNPPLAAWDSDLVRDSAGWVGTNTSNKSVPTTTGPVKIGINEGVIYNPPLDGWQANHVYDSGDYVDGTIAIAAAGHIWEGTGGTSGATPPDWASNFGGTVVDNDITWTDWSDITAGSAHVYLTVQKPVAYP